MNFKHLTFLLPFWGGARQPPRAPRYAFLKEEALCKDRGHFFYVHTNNMYKVWKEKREQQKNGNPFLCTQTTGCHKYGSWCSLIFSPPP
eukprot:NODE_647_length_690_cov_260.301954_g638_i0.p1 GENE.NODE_647_length_690_cov_260.301954_g638_i0~~NODE_647_length_690_cov_260.301954_g638_i0.p1  ORF type:complete len:89 (+),score=17.32 NODE_647_length_690_cov_260.301954_g638_i0:188-454(+)